MQSGNYSAQYGSYLGLHINLVSKSGSNDVHGAVYDYIQNTALNAHQFTDQPGSSKQIQHYNQYGFDLGGPVYIPKLYNGRNKTFFFASYEKINQVQQSSEYPCSDFSRTKRRLLGIGSLNADGSCSGTCIVDPNTGQHYQGNIIPNHTVSHSCCGNCVSS